MVSTALSRIATFWNALVEPVPSLEAPELRQRARLLASLLLLVVFLHVLVLLPLGFAVFSAITLPLHVVAIIVNVICLTVAYLICKFGYIQSSGISVIIYGTVLLTILAIIRENGNMAVLYFFLILMLFANLFFSARAGLAVSVIHITIMLVLPFVTPKIPLTAMIQGPLMFYIASAVICTQYSYIRDHLEAGRQRQLSESEARFRAAVEGSLDAFFLFESVRDGHGKITDFRLIDVNSQSQDQAIISRDVMVGKAAGEIFPERFGLGIFPKLVEVVETGKPYSEETYIPSSRQGKIWFYYQVVRVGDGIAVFSRDINQRKRAEEALRQNENRYRIISESISDYAYAILIDASGSMSLEWITDSFKRLTGYNNEELDPDSLYSVCHPDDRELVLRDFELLREGKLVSSEYRIITKTVDTLWIYSSRFPEWDESSQRMIRYYTVAQDITERKHAEQSLRERERLRIALESERELNQIKNRLMLTISHEFRTPLATIQASSELLQLYFERMSAIQRAGHTTSIQAQVKILAGMLDDISFAVQNASGLVIPHLERIDLVKACHDILDEMQDTLPEDHILRLEVDASTVECSVDVKLFNRMMWNLLSNAVKFSPDGGEIRVGIFEEDDNAVVRVHDQGIGISSEEQLRLFQPFFQTRDTDAMSGMGMGLNIVKQCVTLHGGTVSVESKMGEGSIFTILLPAAPKQSEASAPNTEKMQSG